MEEFSTELQELVSQVDNGQSTLFSWGDMREAERQSERHVVEGVSVDWGEVSIRNHLLEGVEGSGSDSVATLVDAAVAYYCGHPDEAHEMVASAVEDKDSAVVLTTHMLRLVTSVASARGEDAYREFLALKAMCEDGLKHPEDKRFYAASILCGLYAESVLMASVFDLPPMDACIDCIPSNLRVYYGFLHALRSLRQGRYLEAGGIAFAFLTLVDNHYPGARMFLHLISAASLIADSQVERAQAEFMKAWELKKQSGIVAPLVELDYALLGLPRSCLQDLPSDEYGEMESLVRAYSAGWYGLRRRCGLSTRTESLTPLECYVSGLAALGWRNKEIANYLLVSENTVKHQLTSVYQKLNLKSRASLRNIFDR